MKTKRTIRFGSFFYSYIFEANVREVRISPRSWRAGVECGTMAGLCMGVMTGFMAATLLWIWWQSAGDRVP